MIDYIPYKHTLLLKKVGYFFSAPATSFCSGFNFFKLFVPAFTFRDPGYLGRFLNHSWGMKNKKKSLSAPVMPIFPIFSHFGAPICLPS